MRRHYRAYEREPADTEVAETWRMPEMTIEGEMPSSVELTIGEPRIISRSGAVPTAGNSNIGAGVSKVMSSANVPLIAGVGLIGVAALLALKGSWGKKGGGRRRRSYAGRAAMNGFVSEHPWMTFFLASAAISAVATIFTAKAVVAAERLPFQITTVPSGFPNSGMINGWDE